MTTKMNMDEKRKIDKLIVADIDTAISRYKEKREAEEKILKAKLISTGALKIAINAFRELQKKKEQMEKKLAMLGVNVGYRDEVDFYDYDDTSNGRKQNRELKEFDKQTQEGEARIVNLKKSFALKLFAGNEEAQKLFEMLAQELAKIGV